MRLLALKKIDLGHALEMLEISYLLIMRASALGRLATLEQVIYFGIFQWSLTGQ